MKYLGSMKNVDGILEIGGISVKKLAEKYKTPLFIYDLELIEKNINILKENMKSNEFNSTIVYASKAYLSRGIVQVIKKHGLHIDAVSQGELYTIFSTDFPRKNIHMHGNNKSDEEIETCVENEIGSIILDNESEIEKVINACRKFSKKINVFLRLNIGIDAHTHEYIKTAKHNSKFGESIFDEKILEIIKKISDSNELNFLGFHCHIGSQIYDESAFCEAVKVMLGFMKNTSEALNIEIPELNLGGGFGVRYTEEDTDVDLETITKKIVSTIETEIEKLDIKIKNVTIEPGRSIVAQAGSTLYTVGGEKQTFGGEKYIFVDGGMTDNIRPALYQAKYESVIANRLNDEENNFVTVAGKCCESGDILIKGTKLQEAKDGDLLLVSCTGAYGYSMSSNYNMALKPAVVFVKNGKSEIVTKRESYEDLIKNDLLLEELI